MDAGHEELRDSEACTEILRTWPRLDAAFKSSMLADFKIDRLCLLSLLALDRDHRETLVVLIRRHIAARPITEGTGGQLIQQSKQIHEDDPWSYGRMGWSRGCEPH